MRLAVLGSPIAHSRSPALHAVAYETLGLPWRYEAIEVAEGALPGFIDSLSAEWRGLSLTMPLKRAVLPLLDTMDDFVELTDAANTVLFDEDGTRRGFNTDVNGVIDSIRAAGLDSVGTVRVLGGGATAASALVAVSRLGARAVAIAVRAPERLGPLVALCEQLDLGLSVETLGAFDTGFEPELVVSTLPNGTEVGFEAGRMTDAVLFDVAYEPWPTPLAARWLEDGGRVIPGLELLVRQALAQVRIFVNGSADVELPDEAAVFAAMRAAAGLEL